MLRRSAFALLCTYALALAAPALAEPPEIPISIVAGPLPSGLQNLQRQTGIELLYDRDLITGIQAPGVQGNFTTEEALRRLLEETGLTIRRAESGAWIIERLDT